MNIDKIIARLSLRHCQTIVRQYEALADHLGGFHHLSTAERSEYEAAKKRLWNKRMAVRKYPRIVTARGSKSEYPGGKKWDYSGWSVLSADGSHFLTPIFGMRQQAVTALRRIRAAVYWLLFVNHSAR